MENLKQITTFFFLVLLCVYENLICKLRQFFFVVFNQLKYIVWIDVSFLWLMRELHAIAANGKRIKHLIVLQQRFSFWLSQNILSISMQVFLFDYGWHTEKSCGLS